MQKPQLFASIWLVIFLLTLTVIGATTSPAAIEPAQPLQAWSIAPDGAVFVVDANGSLYQLDPLNLNPVQQSAPLLTSGSITQTFLLAATDRVYLGSRTITTTLILDRPNLSQVDQLNAAGPMVLDSGRRLLMMVPEQDRYGRSQEILTSYNLSNLAETPKTLGGTCIPSLLFANETKQQVYFYTTVCENSPPHRRTIYKIVNLNSALDNSGIDLTALNPGVIDRPAIATQTGVIYTLYHNLNYTMQFLILDSASKTLDQTTSQADTDEGKPVTDAQGSWLYTLRQRGLVVRRTADFSLQSFWPFTAPPPTDIALAPDGQTLYLLGNGWLKALSTAELQKTGLSPVSPLPASWLAPPAESEPMAPVFLYPSPNFEQDSQAILILSQPLEYYRSNDGGKSWSFLPGMTEIKYAQPLLSFSPDFSRDQKMMQKTNSGLLQSSDGGNSWSSWSPRIAFTSDREGNRELYTLTEKSEDVLRLTNSPAADENAAWSPAWTYLAFQSDRRGNWDIYTLRADCPPTVAECELSQLTDSPADDMLPAWSPDGRQIAFVSTRDGNPEIYVMDRDGQNQRRLTFNGSGDWRPAWLRDSRHLLFSSGRSGNNDIYQLALPASQTTLLTTEPEISPVITDQADDRDPAVASNGTIFFLSDREGVWRSYGYRIAYDNQPRIEAASEGTGQEGHPSPWSSNLSAGPSLLISLENNGNTDIYSVYPYSSQPLTTNPGFDGQPAGEPVWWQPDPDASLEWLSKNR